MVSYDVQDQLGSTMVLVASGGQIASTYDYDAYGALRSSTITSGIDTTFHYAGQDTDARAVADTEYLAREIAGLRIALETKIDRDDLEEAVERITEALENYLGAQGASENASAD
jgi:YD repeat-containing protein